MAENAATVQRRPPLTRSAIVETAVAVADTSGSIALTMRNIADQLDYKVMALYNHVANKDELLGLMLEAVADEIEDPPEALAPLDSVRALAIAMRTAFVQHPWAPELWLRHMPGPSRTRVMETLLRTLSLTGLSPELEHHGFHAVSNHVIGYTLLEHTMTVGGDDLEGAAATYLAQIDTGSFPHTEAHVRHHLDGAAESSFELVLDIMLDGLMALNSG